MRLVEFIDKSNNHKLYLAIGVTHYRYLLYNKETRRMSEILRNILFWRNLIRYEIVKKRIINIRYRAYSISSIVMKPHFPIMDCNKFQYIIFLSNFTFRTFN